MKTHETDTAARLDALAAEIETISNIIARTDMEEANGLSFLISRWASDLRLIASGDTTDLPEVSHG